MLLKRVASVDWDDSSFGDVLEWLREQSTSVGRVNIIPRWRALDIRGVDARTPVTLELRDVSVAEVLDEVLDQISGRDPITYIGRGNVLRITTLSDIRRKLYTRAYDVAEVIAQVAAERVEPGLFIGHEIGFVRVFGNRGGTGADVEIIPIGVSVNGDPEDFYDDDDQDDAEQADEIGQRMIDWIVATVEPATWDANGGPGSLTLFNGVLTVRNSADVHEQLAGAFRFDE